MNRITIDPVTRLEGHGKIEIFLDPEGEVENAYFQVPELRGFERFCVGAATRAGCGWRCIGSNMPCRGCYGPLPNVHDQGAKMLSAIAACIDSNDPAEVERILDTMPDPAGYFYRFALPASMLQRRHAKSA